MASACKNDIKIIGAQAVNKSYPTFWNDYVRMGGKITKTVEECLELAKEKLGYKVREVLG